MIAQFVYCCDELTGQPFPTQPKLEQWLCSTAEPTPRFKDDIKAVMERFHHLAVTDGLDIGFKQIANRVAPVEFVFIGTLNSYSIYMDLLKAERRNFAIRYERMRR